MRKKKQERPEVQVKPRNYQPTKAELEEDVSIPVSPETLVKMLFQPANVVIDKDP